MDFGRQQKVVTLTTGAVVFIIVIALAVPISLLIANFSASTIAVATEPFEEFGS